MNEKINILVTGGAGNIGSALVSSLIKSNRYFVVIMDNLLTGSMAKLPPKNKENWLFVKGDVNQYRDVAEVILSRNFEYIFHYAAMVGVQRTQESPISVLNDIQGIKKIMDLAKKHIGKTSFLFILFRSLWRTGTYSPKRIQYPAKFTGTLCDCKKCWRIFF